MLVSAVACSGGKSASGQKFGGTEAGQGKRVITDGKDSEKTGSSPDTVSEEVVVENNSLAPPAPVPVPVPGLPLSPGDKVVQDANNKIASALEGALNSKEGPEETPPFTDGPSIVEARDEAAKARDPNVPKDLTDAEKAELGGVGSGTGTPLPPENDPRQQK